MNNRYLSHHVNSALIMSAVLAFAMYSTPPARAVGAEKTPVCLDLGGAWQVAQEGKSDWLPATVPGNVHTDLMKAGKIPDPFFRDNESKVQWLTEL
jgi:hypothetical protein